MSTSIRNFLTHEIEEKMAMKYGMGKPSGFLGDTFVNIVKLKSVKQYSKARPCQPQPNMAVPIETRNVKYFRIHVIM